ncbi:hypothetical protein Tco_1277994, partial [Tanacetum coccineum]
GGQYISLVVNQNMLSLSPINEIASFISVLTLRSMIPRFFEVEATKLTTGRLVNGSSCDGIDKILHDVVGTSDIIAEFCGPCWWKELSKESGSKILPCGDRSCWKAFKPIARLIA